MATNNTFQSLDGMFKEVYADSIKNLLPENVRLQREINFTEATKLGKSFNCPVVLSNAHGVTYAGPTDDVFDLNDPIALTQANAEVQGYQMVLRDVIGYKALSSARSKGKKAFINATRHVVENMINSSGKRVEIAMLYGQVGLGQVSGTTNVNSTTTTLQFTDASWAPGIWAGAENAKVELWDSTDALVSSGSDAIFTVTGVDNSNKQVTVTGSSTGITALDGVTNTPMDVFFQGARTGSSAYNEMAGLDRIITNSGSLFGIDASTYNLWRGNEYDVGSSALTHEHIDEAVSQAVARGGLDGKACVYVSPRTWSDLNTDQAAKRSYDQSYNSGGDASNGFEGIVYHSQNGKIEIKPHNMVKEGEAFIVPLQNTVRVGSSDISFNLGEGHDNERFFRELDNKSGFELRNYTDQAVFLYKPATAVKLYNITNS